MFEKGEMKGVKGKLLKKLKSIKPVGYLKPDRVLQVFASDMFVDSRPKTPDPKEKTPFVRKETEREKMEDCSVTVVEEPEIIDVQELMRDLEEEEEEEEEDMDLNDDIDDKENIRPPLKAKDAVVLKENENFRALMQMEPGSRRQAPLSEIDISSFRRPDLNSCSLFDPNLLAAFEQAVKEHMMMTEAERKARIEEDNIENSRGEEQGNSEFEQDIVEQIEGEPPYKTRRLDDEVDDGPLCGFEEKCPPGGDGLVILYTTTLTGIRKTFEDCNSVRFLLESFRVMFLERDVSMHMEYKEELWQVLGGKAVPPRLFINGRYIGGAEEVLGLHEQGKLKLLMQGIPLDRSNGPCEGCAGVRFLLCYKCSGSHRIIANDGSSSKCQVCNENGLIVCTFCSS